MIREAFVGSAVRTRIAQNGPHSGPYGSLTLRASFLAILAICLSEKTLHAQPIPIANVQRAEAVQFQKDILPLLQKSCLACHSASEKQGALVLETPQTMRTGGDSGPALIPGRGAESLMLKLASHQDEPSMPPAGNDVNAKPLTSEELGLLRLWIDQGARGDEKSTLPSPKALQALPSRLQPVHALALTADGQYAAVSRGNQLFLYHVPTARLVTQLSDSGLNTGSAAPQTAPAIAHRDLIQSLAFNVDGDLLATGSFREIKIWKRPRDVQLQNFAGDGPNSAIAVSPDKKWIAATGVNNSIRLWNAEAGQPGPTLTGHTDKVTSLRFSPDGTRLASSSLDQTLRLWNVADGQPAGVIETTAALNAVEFVPTTNPSEQQPIPPNLLASAGADNFVRTWTQPTFAPTKLPASLANITQFAATHDQKFFALVNAEGTIRVLRRSEPKPGEMSSYETLTEFKPDLPAAAVVFAAPTAQPENSLPSLVTSSADGTVSVWSLPEHTLAARWRTGPVGLPSLASAKDGKLLATGAENGTITLWNLAAEAPKPLDGTTGAPITLAVLSPSGSLLAMAGTSNGQPAVFVRNLDNGQVTHTFTGHEKPILAIAFSPDNTRIVTGSEDQTVRVWNLANPQMPEQSKLLGHTAAVSAVSFSPDGNQILSGSADKLVKLWNLADGMLLKDFPGHSEGILAVGYAANNQPFSVSSDRSIRFWNPADGSTIRAFNDQAKPIAAQMRADRQRIALVGEDKQIRIYQLDNGQLLQTLNGHAAIPTSVSFTQDGKRLVATAAAANQQAGETWLWDVEANPPRLLEGFTDPTVTSAIFGKESNRLLVGNNAGILSTRALRFVIPLLGNTQAITSMLFHSNGQTLFMVSKDGSFRGFNVANGQQTFATNHGAAINSLAISPNEQVLATAGDNNQVRLWQTNGGGFGPQQLSGFPGPVKSVAFSPDGNKVVAGTVGDKPVAMAFDLQTGMAQQRFSQHTGMVLALAPIGDPANPLVANILSAGSDGVWHWGLNGIRHIPGHGAPVTSLAMLPGAPNQVFSGSMDTTIRRWSLENGQQLGQYNHGGAVVSIAIRTDGQRLASASDNHTAKLWNINGQQIAEMRGDVRRKTHVARLQQQQNAASQRVNIAKQRLDAAEQDVPKKTEADKKANETLAAANKDVMDKTAAVEKTKNDKIAAEKVAIEASTTARNAQLAQANAETAARDMAALVPVAQQKAAQLAAASGANPTDENLKKAAADAQAAVTMAQQKAQELQNAVAAPTQAAQNAVNVANQAAQKVTEVQRPYNEALAALRTAMSAQNLASQQQVIAARELKAAQELVPVVKDNFTKAEAAVSEVQKLLEAANQESNAADQAIRTIAFSPDGTLLATAGDFPNVHTWDAETGTALAAFAGHAQGISGLTFLDNARIVSGSIDQSVRIWDLNPSWRLERTIGGIDKPDVISDRVMSLDFSADATLLLAAGGVPSRNGELHLFTVADGNRTLFLPQAHDDAIYSAKFSPDGKRIASAGADKYLRTFDIAYGQQIRRFEGHTNYVLSVAWKGDGQTLVSASADQTIKTWNAETADQIVTIPNFGKHVTAVRFMGESDNIVSSSGDRLVRMHNAFNGGNFRNFGGPDSWLHCVDITPDSNVLAAGSASGIVYLWNGNNGQPLKNLEPPK